MKQSATINIPRIHDLVYSRGSMVRAIEALKRKSVLGYSGLARIGKEWEGDSWDIMLTARDPKAFQHILLPSVTSSTFEVALMALGNPAFHLGNEGFGFWYRVSFVLTGVYILDEINKK